MSHARFQIEEILSQDTHGAVFLATDGESGREVLLQRFFPFGAGEHGLEADERVAYDQAIQKMKQLMHPNLRPVIEGGSDPVDGMPFIVTEIHRGMSLGEYLRHCELTVAQGRSLVENALELMGWLEQRFGQSAEWLSFQPADVEVGQDGASFRFCIDPMKWLGLRGGPSAVQELASLVESSMGWTGRVIAGSTAGRISGWLRAAKSQALSVNEALLLLLGQDQPMPSPVAPAVLSMSAPTTRIHSATHPLSVPYQTAKTTSSRSMLWYVLASITISAIMIGAGIWWYQRKSHYLSYETTEIRKKMGKEVAVIDMVSEVDLSSSGKTLYIQFQQSGNADSLVRGRYLTDHGMKGMSLKELAYLKGKKVRIRGKVAEERPTGRLIIDLTSASQISVVEDK
ncbi:MAG: hypothetical protein RI957_1642 [Verrucomicrobiota bacterium]